MIQRNPLNRQKSFSGFTVSYFLNQAATDSAVAFPFFFISVEFSSLSF